MVPGAGSNAPVTRTAAWPRSWTSCLEDSDLNDMAKNLVLWIIIAVVLMSVFNSFAPSRPAG